MLNYKFTKYNKNNIKTFNIAAINTTIIDGIGYYVLEFDKPHKLSSVDTININQYRNIPIYTRPTVKISINNKYIVSWRYNDNSNDWIILGDVRTLTNIIVVDDYILNFNIINDLIKVKINNSIIYQDIISVNQVDLFNKSFYSEDVLIKEIVIDDNYIRVENTEFLTQLDIRYDYYNNDNHVFRTEDMNLIGKKLTIRQNNTDIKLPNMYLKSDGTMGGVDANIFDDMNMDEIFDPIDVGENDGIWNTQNDGDYLPIAEYIDYKVNYIIIDDGCEKDYIDFYIVNPPIDTDLIDVFFYTEEMNFNNVWIDDNSYQIPLTTIQDYSPNTNRGDLISTEFVDKETKNAINQIIDTERIRYFPVRRILDNGNVVYQELKEIDFNLCFRDNSTNTWTSIPTPWGNLGFINEDVKYQRNRLKKTFIRLTYFDEQNPTSQSLEYYNTVFVNVNDLYSKYMRDYRVVGSNDGELLRTSFEIKHPNTFMLKNSSEGFYLYLFNANKPMVEPVPIYMRVEFNNALDGQKHLFFNRSNSLGVDMNNIFFDVDSSKNYIYIKIYCLYVEEIDKYVYYFDDDLNITYSDDKVIINLYEAYIK